tara:strand:- start:185 stop:343 length:159 start_codon:yes stop_codon:yes gene_type:complete
MTNTTRGKITFMMPDSWSKEKTEKFADNTIKAMAPKIKKLNKPERKAKNGNT